MKWLTMKRNELKQLLHSGRPDITSWDIYQFISIINEKDKEIRRLNKLLKHHGVWYD